MLNERKTHINKKTMIYFILWTFLVVLMNSAVAFSERLPSYNYSVGYGYVETEIDNPKTSEGIYTDTLDWSPGGEVKLGLRAIIGLNKKNKEYLPTELVGVRSGIKNVSDSTVQLACAYYSPNKHGIPPEYTLFIEGPQNYPHIIGYLGNDVLYVGPRTKLQNMISISPGKVFNPSPDSLFYNVSDGLFSFETPGTYTLFFTYSFDSLTSSLQVPLTSISSDTIDLKVITPEFIDSQRLIDFLPKNIHGLKSGRPEYSNDLLNPHWTGSLQYPRAFRHYFRKPDNFDAPHIGILIIDSGHIPDLLSRYNSLCRQTESSRISIKGFPGCELHEPAAKGNRSYATIHMVVANRIIITVEGWGVSVEEAENAAKAIDYSAIVESITR